MFHRYRLASSALAVALVIAGVVLIVAGCGGSAVSGSASGTTAPAAATIPHAHPQAIEPSAGSQAAAVTPSDPVGDPNAHAMPISEVQHLLALEKVAAKRTSATYIDPLQYVNRWERTDQGVDAKLPVGAPILAPGPVKILAVIPDWYAGQPLVYFELLNGQQAGQIQYVAEQITDIAEPGLYLQQGQVIARYAASGTAIEYGWSTLRRDHARARHHRLRRGRDHARGRVHAQLAERPRRERRPELIRSHRRRSWGNEVTSRGMSDRACASASSSAVAASASIDAPCPTSSIDGR